MRTVHIIGCTSSKKSIKSTVKDMYSNSALFKAQLWYFENVLGHAEVRVLSAKYGLLKLTDVIEPYDLKITKLSKAEKEKWVDKVVNQLHELDTQRLVWHTSDDYHASLLSRIPLDMTYKVQFDNSERMGERQQFYVLHQKRRNLYDYPNQTISKELQVSDKYLIQKLNNQEAYIITPEIFKKSKTCRLAQKHLVHVFPTSDWFGIPPREYLFVDIKHHTLIRNEYNMELSQIILDDYTVFDKMALVKSFYNFGISVDTLTRMFGGSYSAFKKFLGGS